MEKTKLFHSVALLLLLFSMLVTSASAGKIGMDSFTDTTSDPTEGLGDAKPLMLEVVGFVVALYLISCALGIFGGGTTSNIGSFMHSISLRMQGITAILSVLGVLVLVIGVIFIVFKLYNEHLAGSA